MRDASTITTQGQLVGWIGVCVCVFETTRMPGGKQPEGGAADPQLCRYATASGPVAYYRRAKYVCS